MRAARLTVDAGAGIAPSVALAAAVQAVPLVVVSHRALADLADELGGYEQAARRLLTIATGANKPIGMNVPTADGSRTMFVAPAPWSRERLAGYVAAHHEALERQFGAASVVAEEEGPC